MIYLIGGAPRVGKSQFMQKLISRKAMPSISCDFLYDLEQIKTLDGFAGANILEKGRAFYPTLKQLLADISVRSEDCIIEGEVILPEFVPELSKMYDIRCCFLGLSKTNLETILTHGGFFNWPQFKLSHHLEAEVQNLAERTIERSNIIRQECEKFQTHYFDLADDYSRVIEQAADYLLGES